MQAVAKNTAAQMDNRHDDEISTLVDHIRQHQKHINELTESIQFTKTRLRSLLEQRGANWSDNSGYARLTSEGVRRSYDNHALDGLILHDPLHYGWLKDYRRESTTASTVQVK